MSIHAQDTETLTFESLSSQEDCHPEAGQNVLQTLTCLSCSGNLLCLIHTALGDAQVWGPNWNR